MYIRTAKEFAAAVTIGITTELLTLDFKETIDFKFPKGSSDEVKQKTQQETCRDIAQFANTNGGCLLVGVEESRDPVTGLKVASGIRPVSQPDAMREWIEQAIRNYLVPATFAHSIDILQDPRGTVVTINVPPSLHLVALWHSERKSQFEEKHSIEYLYRDSHGKKWMNPDEVEKHMVNGSRAAKLTFDLALSKVSTKQVRITGGYWQREANTSTGAQDQRWSPKEVTVGIVGEQEFELQFSVATNTLVLNLPYGVIKEVWVGADRCLNLLLELRIVYWENHQLIVEPYG